MQNDKLSRVVSLCRRRGFVFGSCQIYGGLSGVWDYGPLGVRIKRKIKNIWWQTYVERHQDIVGLDSAIIMHRDVFVASGHLSGFADYLIECSQCKRRFRIDKINKIQDNAYLCPKCTATINTSKNKPKKFNLMLKTNLSASEDNAKEVYLRPETAQGIFINFTNVLNVVHKKLPFGIAQIGKAFRNEVTTGNFIFRMKEFEQMEIEYFINPADADKSYEYWIDERYNFYHNKMGIKKENLRLRPHTTDELAHYAKACTDIEYNFPFSSEANLENNSGWNELEGIANRTDYDLRQHSKASNQDLSYFDAKTNSHYIPYVIEPSAGVDRTFLAIICDAYKEEDVREKKRVVLKIKPELAPYCAAIFPLLRNDSGLVGFAKNIFYKIKDKLICIYDDTASIGKLYRRQDEIGTPFCITVDKKSLEDDTVTVRERDTMLQERIPAENIVRVILNKLSD